MYIGLSLVVIKYDVKCVSKKQKGKPSANRKKMMYNVDQEYLSI